MQDEHQNHHIPPIDESHANDESVIRTHAQIRRSKVAGSPVTFFTTIALVVVIVFAWFYVRRYFAKLDSNQVLADRGYIHAMANQPSGDDLGLPAAPDGAQLYAQQCAACHQPTGQGLAGAFPPLAGSEWVTGDAELPIKILLAGLGGPIEVKGNTYNGAMPAFGAAFSDAQIAAVVTYIRESWDNGASEVTEEQVAAVRSDIGTRGTWTAAELQEYFQ